MDSDPRLVPEATVAARFYERVAGDPEPAPIFEEMDSEHPQHVARFLAEVLGGPALYSEHHGGHAHMIRQHLGRNLTDAQRSRWIAGIADEAGAPDDPEFRSAFVGYQEWGSRRAHQLAARSHGERRRSHAEVGLGRSDGAVRRLTERQQARNARSANMPLASIPERADNASHD